MTYRNRLAASLLCAATAVAPAAARAQGFVEAPAPAQPPQAPPAEEAPAPVPAEAPVRDVTVYQGTALVAREVAVPEGRGLVEVVVTPLPPAVLPGSLYTEGNEAMRVLSTRFRTRALKEDVRAEVRAKEEEIRALETEGKRLEAQIQAARRDAQYLDKLEDFTAATSQNLVDRVRFDGEAIVSLSEFLMGTRVEKATELVDLEARARVNAEAVEFARRQLAEIAAGSTRTASDAVILLDKSGPEAGAVRLNYLVSAASWRPQYRVRAGGDDEPVRLEYLAAVTQQTGEEWADAAVTLSTAQPSLNAMPPDLVPLALTVSPLEEGQADDSLPARSRMMGMGGMGGMGGGFGGMGGMGLSMEQYQAQSFRDRAEQEALGQDAKAGGAILNQAAAADQAQELLAQDEGPAPHAGRGDLAGPDGPSVTFHLPNRLTLPSRRDPLLVEVARSEMTPEFFDKTVPVLSPRVYRLANLTNNGRFVLLPGEATMYVGNDFVGRMTLPLVAAGEQFTVGFGVDPQVQVYRRLMEKSRTVQGGNQVRTYDFRIAVRSFRTQPVAVQVWDRLPRAESEAAAVNLVKVDPPLSDDANYQRNVRPDNLLRWDLEVAPESDGGKPRVITYQFRLEYARGMGVEQITAGLQEGPIGGGAASGFGGAGFRSLPAARGED